MNVSEDEKLSHLMTCIVCSLSWKVCPHSKPSLLFKSIYYSFNSFPLSSTFCRNSFSTNLHLNSWTKGSQGQGHAQLSQKQVTVNLVKGVWHKILHKIFSQIFLKDVWVVIKYAYTKRMKHGNKKGKFAWNHSLCESYSLSIVAPVQLQLSDFKFYFTLKNNQSLLKINIKIYRDVQFSSYCILWPEAFPWCAAHISPLSSYQLP